MFKLNFISIKVVLVTCLLYCIGIPMYGQQEKALPIDPAVTYGELENGLKYYIKKNSKPENYAELRLAVNAGSILETDAQQGLAHFVEHMCFNGTKNFPKSDLVDYLESIGTKFGAHLNAYTSFDETVYMLRVPTDDEEKFNTGFQILEDWAHNVSFDNEEIDKERGVVIEEWRTRLGPQERMQQKYFPMLFKDSHYAKRLPIGKKDILETFEYETLKSYYNTWYRPDLMAVIAIGDFDVAEVEAMIKEKFGRIEPATDPKERTEFEVPDHEESLIAIESDEEAPYNMVMVQFKHESQAYETVKEYKNYIIEELYNGMLGARLSELTQQANPPFIFGNTSYGSMTRTKDAYSSFAIVPDNGFSNALEALLIENERVRLHGFTQTEFERQKAEILRSLQKANEEKDKTESNRLVWDFVYHYLEGSPAIGTELELQYHTKMLPVIELEEVNELAKKWVTDENRVVIITGSKKEGNKMPTEEEIREVLKSVSKAKPEAYKDEVLDAPLVSDIPEEAEIKSEVVMEELGVKRLMLANGVEVILKQTDFKNDELLMNAYRYGGHSNFDDEKYMSASMAANIVANAGVNEFSQVQLDKYMSDKVVSVYPYLSEMEEGMRGNCSVKDIETMFQMIYAYFKYPREDEEAYESFMSKMTGWYKNMLSNPDNFFFNEVAKVMSQDHLRRGYPTEEKLSKVDMKDAYKAYRERFGNASGFTFVFVGSFEEERMKSLCQTYLGNLPSGDDIGSWKNVGINGPEGQVEKVIKKGKEPKSKVSMNFTGELDWNLDNRYDLISMVAVLKIMLRESMREDQGGVYGVGVSSTAKRYPEEGYKITISWTCSPDNVETLIQTVLKDVETLKMEGTTDKYLTKVKETQRKEIEVGMKDNRWWLNQLSFYTKHKLDPNMLQEVNGRIDGLNSEQVKAAAELYFNMENYAKIILYPEVTEGE